MIYTFELLLNLLLSDFPSSTTRQEVARGQLSGGYWLGAYARDTGQPDLVMSPRSSRWFRLELKLLHKAPVNQRRRWVHRVETERDSQEPETRLGPDVVDQRVTLEIGTNWPLGMAHKSKGVKVCLKAAGPANISIFLN